MTSVPMTYRQHTKAVLVLGLPLIGGQVAQFAIGMTDTIMMGWYGVPELAALTLATSVFFVLFLLGSGFAFALMPLVATFAAQEDETQIRRATRMALWWSIGYFVIVMPILWFSEPILLALGQEDGTARLAQQYLRIAGWGMLPGLGMMVLRNYLSALEHASVVLWVTIAAVLVNVVANYALIFGNFGLPRMGIDGAALASIVAQSLMLLLVVQYAIKVLPEHQLFVRFWNPDREMLAKIFAIGLPIGLTTLAESSLFSGAAMLMGTLGEVPLAAHGVVLNLAALTFMLQLGLSQAATVRAGNALGRGDAPHLQAGAKVVIVLSLVGVALSMVLFLSFPDQLINLFLSPDEPKRAAILEIGRVLLVMAVLFQLVDAMQVVHLGFLRGLHDTGIPMVVAVISYWGIGFPAAWLFGTQMGFEGVGVWSGLVLGLSVAALLLGWRFWTWGTSQVKPVS